MLPLSQRFKERKVVQWLLAYLAGAWVAFEVVGQVAHTLGWGEGVERAALVILCAGALAALVLAWYHGERGRQSVSAMEILMLSGILVLTAVGLVLVRDDGAEGTPRDDATSSTRPVEAASIAVLPFENFGAEDDRHFSDGISEEILNVLAQIPGLRVAARTSSFVYRDASAEITDIAATLGVSHVLEGSIRRSGDQLRITAQLIDGRSGFHLWSDAYDRALTPSNIFEVQDEIARTVGRELQLRVSNLATSAEYQTDDAEAHEEYLRGLSLTARGDEASLREAVALLESATRRDPGYVLAWSGLAVAHGLLADAYVPADEAYPRVLDAANRALALAPDLEMALASRIMAHASTTWDMDAATADVAHLDSLDARTPWSQLARMIHGMWLGEGSGACSGLREAGRVDPLNPTYPYFQTFCYSVAGEHREAIRAQRETLALAPDFFYMDTWGGFAYSELGDDAAAMEEFERAERATGRPSVFLVLHLVKHGRADEARQVATRITEAVRAGTAQIPPELVAMMWSELGDVERTFEWLEEGVRQRSPVAILTPFMPRMSEIARSERYRALAAAYGVPLSPALR